MKEQFEKEGVWYFEETYEGGYHITYHRENDSLMIEGFREMLIVDCSFFDMAKVCDTAYGLHQAFYECNGANSLVPVGCDLKITTCKGKEVFHILPGSSHVWRFIEAHNDKDMDCYSEIISVYAKRVIVDVRHITTETADGRTDWVGVLVAKGLKDAETLAAEKAYAAKIFEYRLDGSLEDVARFIAEAKRKKLLVLGDYFFFAEMFDTITDYEELFTALKSGEHFKGEFFTIYVNHNEGEMYLNTWEEPHHRNMSQFTPLEINYSEGKTFSYYEHLFPAAYNAAYFAELAEEELNRYTVGEWSAKATAACTEDCIRNGLIPAPSSDGHPEDEVIDEMSSAQIEFYDMVASETAAAQEGTTPRPRPAPDDDSGEEVLPF